jgi:type II secretory pathway component PulL
MFSAITRPWAKLRPARGWAGVFFGPAELQVATVPPANESDRAPQESTIPLPAEPADLSAQWQAAAQSLRQQIQPEQSQIVTAIGGEDVLCQIQQFPTADPAELRQMLDLQLDNLTPLPAEEVVYSFEALGTADGQTRVLVAIARKDAVNQRVAPLEAAGLPVAVVTVDALAVFRALVERQALPADDRQNVAVIVTPTAANVVVFSRALPVAIRSVALPADGQIAEELRRSLLSLDAGGVTAEPGSVTVVNVNAVTRALAEELAGSCGAALMGEEAVPSPALSLCLAPEAGRLNLLPDEWRERRRQARLRRDLIRGGMALAAVYVVALAVFGVVLIWRRAQLNGVRTEISRLQPEFRRARDTHNEMMAMQRQLDTKYSALEVLREVSGQLADPVKLSAFVFKKDQKVTLRGQAQTAGAALEYVDRLQKCELFAGVKTVSMSTPAAGGLTKFEVDCRLQTATPNTGDRGWR